ncbi:MAG: phytoene/squalene synthase family protein [Alphaproteobacteria bacterium]
MKREDNSEVPGAAYCAEEVRTHDPDRYFAALFAPAPVRERLLALYAFAHEVAKVRETVTQPMLGEIRLQWWRETVDAFAEGEVRRHPVAEALSRTVDEAGLPPSGLHALIDVRSVDLDDAETPLEDEAALAAYADGTAGALMALARQVQTGTPPEGATAEAARAGGRAWACTGLLRALPYHARDRRIFIPRSILRERGVATESVFAGRHTPELALAMADMAAMARDHLAQARASGAARGPAFLYLSLCDLYLKQTERPGFDPFRMPVRLSEFRRLRRMWSRAVRGTV